MMTYAKEKSKQGGGREGRKERGEHEVNKKWKGNSRNFWKAEKGRNVLLLTVWEEKPNKTEHGLEDLKHVHPQP